MSGRTSWWLAIRPKTLTAAFVPIVVGTALACSVQGHVRLDLMGLALLSSLLIQIATNFINDAMDFKKGADTAERLGPQRVTQSGLLSGRQVWWSGILLFTLAIVCALPLVWAGGWPIVVVGVCSILAGYAYTGGPFPLAYVGLGDLFVLIFFGWVAVCGTYYLNVLELSAWCDPRAWVAGTQVGLLATIMIAVNNLRDRVSDRQVGKMTLAARWGEKFVRWELVLLSGLPFLGSVFWMSEGFLWASVLPWVSFPLAWVLVRGLWKPIQDPRLTQFFARGVALHLVFGLLLSLGLVL